MNGLAFEIIAETEIPQHLKKSLVVRRTTHIVDVPGSQTLLTCGRPDKIKFDFAQEVVFELVHTRRRE